TRPTERGCLGILDRVPSPGVLREPIMRITGLGQMVFRIADFPGWGCISPQGLYFEGNIMRILVVEDDKKIASFVVQGLKQNGFAVDHCADGEEALFRAQTISYDAAIVDLMLPKLDGLSLIQQ